MIRKSFFITGALVGMIFAFQNNASPTVPLDDKLEQEKDLKEIILLLDNEHKLLQAEYSDLVNQASGLNGFRGVDQSNLQDLKNQLGYEEMKGAGLEMILKGNVDAGDLRDIVNVLREVGVSGISVGSQRIIFSTPIIDLNDIILVGNTKFKAPIVLRTIGDSRRIISKFSESKFLSNVIKKNNSREIQIELNEKEITLPKI